MFNQSIKKAAKLQKISLILTISILTPYLSSSQIDTFNLRRDIEKVLNKYGLKNNPYQFIISDNQSGGQTAYTITNNYSPYSHVVNGTNLGINGDISINEKFQLTNKELDNLVNAIRKLAIEHNKKKDVIILDSYPGSDVDVFIQLSSELPKRGIKIIGTGQILPTDGITPFGIDYDTSGNTIAIGVGYFKK